MDFRGFPVLIFGVKLPVCCLCNYLYAKILSDLRCFVGTIVYIWLSGCCVVLCQADLWWYFGWECINVYICVEIPGKYGRREIREACRRDSR